MRNAIKNPGVEIKIALMGRDSAQLTAFDPVFVIC